MSVSLFPYQFLAIVIALFQIQSFHASGQTHADHMVETLQTHEALHFHWLESSEKLWFTFRNQQGVTEFVTLSTKDGQLQHHRALEEISEKIPSSIRLSEQTKWHTKSTGNGPETTLTFINEQEEPLQLFWLKHDGKKVDMGIIPALESRTIKTYEHHAFLLHSQDEKVFGTVIATAMPTTIQVDAPAPPRQAPSPSPHLNKSPNENWEVRIRQDQVELIDLKSKVLTQFPVKAPFLSRIEWSPSSDAFVVFAWKELPLRELKIVESTPQDQLQPKIITTSYPKPGDPLPNPSLYLFRTDGTFFPINSALFPQPFLIQPYYQLTWNPSGSHFYFDYNQRGQQCYRILEVNARDGKVRVIAEETSQTFIETAKKRWRHWLHSKNQLIWTNQSTGWNHLYLHDLNELSPPRALTQGNWVVRNVLRVDEEQGVIWFTASGLRPEEDPYHLHLCSVRLDGTDFRQLTEGDGTHEVDFSPDGNYFLAHHSRADLPPVYELRASADGKLIKAIAKMTLEDEKGNVTQLPERLSSPGRDDQTLIYGLIYTPKDFDPNKKYPVIENIYAGPHDAFVPKAFARQRSMQDIANEGFVVVKVDGMGTNHRGKAFHDLSWKNLKDAGFPDRKRWIQAAAKTRPWMDLSRVGIYGGSAGGQSAMRALLDHHDFYHVAVADCGCHDNRMDKVWWNEQWMGWPVDASYVENSNMEDAAKLQGKLLLIVGELDTNVDPASTYQVVSALQKAGKDFDFMPIMGAGHGAAETPFGKKTRLQFLKKHLLHEHP